MKKNNHSGRQPRCLDGVRLVVWASLLWLAIGMAVALRPSLAVAGQRGWTPQVGSSERQAIAAVLRQEVKALHRIDVQFVITYLKVKDDWAWVQTRPQSLDGKNNYEDIAALLSKVNGGWRICEIPCTEPDNPDCLGEPDFFQGLQRRFPEAPLEIFPGF